jgi:hypothetical protein
MDNDGSLDFMRRLTFWVWTYFAVTPVAMVVLVLKVVCLGGLFFALYIINKDLFVYFKARASDEMRQRWLRKFTDRYSYLAQRVSAAKASKDEELVEKIKELWNNGCPSSKYILDGFSPRPSNISESGPDVRWKYLLEGKKSVAVWMFDVPGIARWESELENLLNKK